MVNIMKSALNLFGLSNKEGGRESIKSMNDFLEGLSHCLPYEINFSEQEEIEGEPPLRFEVSGAESSDFLGEDIEVLEALGHLSMRVNRKLKKGEQSPDAEPQERIDLRVSFDSDSLRENRVNSLKEIAKELKQKVIDNDGKHAFQSALGPSERKVIHTYISELGEVVSESIGNGYFKRIRIKLENDVRKKSFKRDNSNANSNSNYNKNSNGNNKNSNYNKSRGNGPRKKSFNKDDNFGNKVESKKAEKVIDENIGNKPGSSDSQPYNFD